MSHSFPNVLKSRRRRTIFITDRQRLDARQNRGFERLTSKRQQFQTGAEGALVRKLTHGTLVGGGAVAILLLLLPSNVFAEADAAFTVGNYPVEAKANNAVAAKKKALTDGRHAAFKSLLKRLVPVTAYSRIANLNSTDAGAFVDGVAVRSERNSATEYIASLDFTFRADEVRNLLRRQGIPFIDEQAPVSVLVPIVRQAANKAPPKTDPRWNETWQGLDLQNTLSPLRIEPLKPVVHVDTIRMALAADSNAERILATEYQAQRVMLVVATIDQGAKKIHVSVVGHDAVGPINWTRSYRLVDGDVAYTLELVAVVTLGVLEGRWKAYKTESYGGLAAISAPAASVPIQVAFSGLHEWNIIRRKLLETPGVENVQINAVSARGATVALSYPGGGGPLASTLSAQGLSLMQSGNVWVLALRY